MRISDWSSDVCSSDLDLGDEEEAADRNQPRHAVLQVFHRRRPVGAAIAGHPVLVAVEHLVEVDEARAVAQLDRPHVDVHGAGFIGAGFAGFRWHLASQVLRRGWLRLAAPRRPLYFPRAYPSGVSHVMAESRHSKVFIIGSGAAGLTAAIYAARANLKPVLVQGLQPGGQMTITSDVANYPGFADVIQGPWLMEQMQKQAEHVGTEDRKSAV